MLSCVCVGDLCAACNPSHKWCRVKVTKIIKHEPRYENDIVENNVGLNKDEVEIMFIDFGKTTSSKVTR